MNLHLGCDKRYIPGFTHIDLADYPHIDYKHDIRTLPMIKDESVDLIYVCHALEYFDRVEIVDVLAEWRRVLRLGATLRIAVPNFEAMVQVYQKYGDLSLIIGPLFGRWQIRSGPQAQFIYHRTVYDFKSLRAVLESCGFTNVHRYEWRETIHRDHDDYSQAYIPHMDKDHGILISLNIEATKS
jgi:predicted SAM-dependent methyltransferase